MALRARGRSRYGVTNPDNPENEEVDKDEHDVRVGLLRQGEAKFRPSWKNGRRRRKPRVSRGGLAEAGNYATRRGGKRTAPVSTVQGNGL